MAETFRNVISSLYEMQSDGFICPEQFLDHCPNSIDDENLIKKIEKMVENKIPNDLDALTFIHAILFIQGQAENTMFDTRTEEITTKSIVAENFNDY